LQMLLLLGVSLLHLLRLLLMLLLHLLHLSFVCVLLHRSLVVPFLLLRELLMLLFLSGVELLLLFLIFLVDVGVTRTRRSRLRMRGQVLGVDSWHMRFTFLRRSRHVTVRSIRSTVCRGMVWGTCVLGCYNTAPME